jgi:hypothetical protein
MKGNNCLLGMLVFICLFWFIGCASIKILTPQAVDYDIGGIPNLANCQYYLSKDIILRFISDTRQTGLNEAGVVQAEWITVRRTINFASSTPGILQTTNNAGENLPGYKQWTSEEGRVYLDLYILFEDDNDNSLKFQAFYDSENDRFELLSDEVVYDGLNYTITYSGDEYPCLKYKLVERSREDTASRRARGRRLVIN